ncbi:MAG: hypothetical protein P1P86_14805 [Bacteroidales bacterium]|nr:hypothetical protein [Bacteroidales bacterium]
MNRTILLGLALLVLSAGPSCTSTQKISVEEQRRGLLLMEGEQIYKNRGFYKAKKSKKQRRKTLKASRRKYKR